MRSQNDANNNCNLNNLVVKVKCQITPSMGHFYTYMTRKNSSKSNVLCDSTEYTRENGKTQLY